MNKGYYFYAMMFDEMQIGDYVICARGANKNKQIFFAGMVSSENSHDWPYTRKLTGFVDLGKEKIEFGNNNAFGSSARIPAIYELKKDNEADYEICKYIKETVNGSLEVISNGTMNISDYEVVLPYIDALNISIDGYDDKTSFIRDSPTWIAIYLKSENMLYILYLLL